MTRKTKPARVGRKASDTAATPKGESDVEKAEQQPDRSEGPAADADERIEPLGSERTGQSDIERAHESRQGSIETVRQPATEDDVTGFVDPEST